MNAPTARWAGNTLVVNWYGSAYGDDAAIWCPRTATLICDGNDETLERVYHDRPDAATALAAILQWQEQ